MAVIIIIIIIIITIIIIIIIIIIIVIVITNSKEIMGLLQYWYRNREHCRSDLLTLLEWNLGIHTFLNCFVCLHFLFFFLSTLYDTFLIIANRFL